MRQKTNKNLSFEKDNEKSYIYIKEGKKDIGILMWHCKKRKWVFDGCNQITNRQNKNEKRIL